MRLLTSSVLSSLAATALLAAMGSAALAAADPGYLPKEGEVVKPPVEKGGWDPALSFGATVAITSNSSVVGQQDGSSWTFGLNLLGRLDLLEEIHDWRNTLKITEVLSRTPTIEDWIKTADQLFFESVYYLKLAERVGPFVSFKLETPLFRGQDVRGAAVDYVLASDGSMLKANATSLKLTDGFQPLTLKEAIGVFYRPLEEKGLEVDIRAGFGARQTFADGAYVLTDDGATAAIEVTRLTDFVQGGAVIGIEAKGQAEEGRITYSAHAEVMFPVINDDPAGRDVIELTNYDLGAKLGFKLFEWASLDYELKAFRQPALVDAWQIQNNLLLTFTYTLID